jgi:hypothetical protein
MSTELPASVEKNSASGSRLVLAALIWYSKSTVGTLLSHWQNNLFAQTLRYAQNFILEISIVCLW